MSYLHYVVAGYAAFALALLWDFVSPRLQWRSLLRAIHLRGERRKVRSTGTPRA